MNNDLTESELIFKIYRLKNSKEEWVPAIIGTKSHDITPLWAAGVAFVILDRYLNSIDEPNQIKFQEEMLYWLGLMLKDNAGSACIEKVDKLKDMD